VIWLVFAKFRGRIDRFIGGGVKWTTPIAGGEVDYFSFYFYPLFEDDYL
jgi:hypothetical protein